MSGVSVVESGNYDLQIATGFLVDAFTLDDPLKSLLDSTDYVLDGTTEFASVLDGTTQVTVKRGRRDVGDAFSTGTLTATLLDVEGIFNPFNQDSPYYDTPDAKPGLAPLRAVKLIRYDIADNAEQLFNGYIVNYDYNFDLGGLSTVTVYAADQFYLLSQTALDAHNVDPETSGERIETVLDYPEVDFPLLARNINTGTVNLGHDSAYNIEAGTNVLTYITQINQTAEFGRLFMSRAGVLNFQPRIGATLSNPVIEFDDEGNHSPFNGVGITFEADQVVNRAVVTGLDGTTSTASDPASIATYFIQNTSILGSLLHEQDEIDDAAAYLLNPEPEARYTTVETAFLMLTNAERDDLATIEIGDTISVSKTFPTGNTTSVLAQDLSIEGIEHRINLSTGHSVTLFTAPTTIVFQLILDDPLYGQLDEENVLG
jgi:hypothetical protein